MASRPVTEEDYSIEALTRLTKTLPAFKLSYCRGENGWASDLGDGRAIIDNIPFHGPLRYLDVVEMDWCHRPVPKAGKIIWRAYGCKALVQYPKGDAEQWYANLRQLCAKHGWACEGAVAGFCVICLPGGANLPAELARAGLAVERLELDCDG